ncbi:Hsp90 cochaperone [Mactra antiquata]
MPSKKQLQQAEEIKEKGNACVKEGNYHESIVHYSHAIQLDPKNHVFYSNRSLSFLKLQQYYLALEDARKTIQLQPEWPKGYYRKGNVEYAAGHYRSALLSFGRAMLLDPNDSDVRAAVKKTNDEVFKMRKREMWDPYISAISGACIGLFIVIADWYFTKKPSIKTYYYGIIIIITFTVLGYLAMKGYRYIREKQRLALLEQPIDLLKEMDPQSINLEMDSEKQSTDSQDISNSNQRLDGTVGSSGLFGNKTRKRGGASAGRQKFKMGKSHQR